MARSPKDMLRSTRPYLVPLAWIAALLAVYCVLIDLQGPV